MKVLTVRLPGELALDIEAEAKARGVSKSDVIRDRLQSTGTDRPGGATGLAAIADVIGSVPDLPADLSADRKAVLRATGYGRKRSR